MPDHAINYALPDEGPETEPREPHCPRCDRVIDLDCCWCGQDREHHGSVSNPFHGDGDGHLFVPDGCVCHRRLTTDADADPGADLEF